MQVEFFSIYFLKCTTHPKQCDNKYCHKQCDNKVTPDNLFHNNVDGLKAYF